MSNIQIIIAWISYFAAHSTAIVAVISAVILILQGHWQEGLTALGVALAAWSNPRKPDPSLKVG